MPSPTRLRRLLPQLVSAALVLCAWLAHPRALAAQGCDPTVPFSCQEPPGVTIDPADGSWTGLAQSITQQVQVEFCNSGTGPFGAGGETYTLDGQAQSFTSGAVANGCYTATGTLTLTVGTHTFVASKTNGAGTGTASATYVYALQPLVPGVTVGPHSGAVTRPGSYGTTEVFSVVNTGNGPTAYTVQAACTGAAINCSLSASTVSLPAGGTANVGVNYVPNGVRGATGTIQLKAWVTSQATVRDSGTYALTVDTLALRGKPGLRPDMRRLDRDVCVILAAGAGAAFECGDLRLVHDLPGVRLLNRSRAPTLVYSSQHAAPQPLFVAYVAPAAGTRPDTIRAVLTVNGVNYGSRWPGWPSDTTKRIAVPLPDTLRTGVYGYTLTVTGTWNNGAPAQAIYSASSEFVMVNRQKSPFGAGWWLAGLEQLVPASGNRWAWVGGDGSYHVYSPVATGVWVTDTYDRPDTLKQVGSLLVRRLPGGTEVRYDAFGYHVQTVNPLGQATSFGWNAARTRLDSIALPVGGYVYRFTYGNDGGTRLSSVSSPGATGVRTTTIATAADGTGRVTQITDPDTKFVVFGYTGTDWRVMKRTDRRNYTTRFIYGEGSKLTGSRLPAAVGDTLATTFRAEEGQGVTTAVASVYTYMSGPVSGRTTSWVLDSYGAPYRLAEAIRGDTYIYRGDPRFPGLVTRVDYPNGRSLTASYDARGNPIATTDWSLPIGGRYATTLYEWDPVCDAVTRTTAPEGASASMAYDSTCRVLWTQPGTDARRRVSVHYRSLTAPVAPGLPDSIYSPDGGVESFDYDARGNLASTRSPRGNLTRVYADLIGRDTLVAPPAGDSTRTSYDVMSRPFRSVRFAGSDSVVVASTYDEESHVTRITNQVFPDTNHVDVTYNDWRYDGAGRQFWWKDPTGKVDSTLFNAAGQDTMHFSRRLDPVTGLRYVLRTRYDALGRVIQRITPSAHYAADSVLVYGGSWWRFPKYPLDADSSYASPRVIPADTARFTYDQMGNLRTAVNRDAWIARGYDLQGRLIADTLRIRPWTGRDSTVHVYVIGYGYDLEGRRVWMKHPPNLAAGLPTADTLETYSYDRDLGALAAIRDLTGNNYRFTYNLTGQVDSVYKPNGELLVHGYDLDGNHVRTLSNVYFHSDSMSYDARGRLVYGASVEMPFTSLFTPFGALKRSENNALGETNITVPDPLGNAFSERRRVHNLDGDPDQMDVLETHNYTHDGSARVTGLYRVKYISNEFMGDASYYYDRSGNRDRSQSRDVYQPSTLANAERRWVQEHSRSYYGADERLHAVDRQRCNVYESNTGTFCIAWERYRGWEPSVHEQYRYDALGRRVYRRTRAGSGPYQGENQCPNADSNCSDRAEWTIWDGDQVLWEVRTSGGELDNQARTDLGRVGYTHGGLDAPLSLYRINYTAGSAHTLIIHRNWRGVPDDATFPASLADTVRPDLKISDIAWPAKNYDAVYRPVEVLVTPRWFGSLQTGSRDASGQFYRRNRYYDAATGHFTQSDPIGLGGGLNTYGFAGGDPVSFSDPYGLCAAADTTPGTVTGQCPIQPSSSSSTESGGGSAGVFVGGGVIVGGGAAAGGVSAGVGETVGGAGLVATTVGAIGAGIERAFVRVHSGIVRRTMPQTAYPEKPGAGGRLQPYNPANGRYLSPRVQRTLPVHRGSIAGDIVQGGVNAGVDQATQGAISPEPANMTQAVAQFFAKLWISRPWQ
ncbi:MAG TPA: RHS repeat-associated core domain-containing protein [Longimicrobiaceae bacterium]|nr:RHS repeat-associated core domain-containing protein [Longimicrobiaceae bacterium]